MLATWQAVLGDAAWMVSREQAVDEGWFGPSPRRFADRIGDVVAAALGAPASPARTRSRSPAWSGSTARFTSAEQLVPLLIARAAT